MRKLVWFCSLILGLTGCAAKPEAVLTTLPLAVEAPGASASVREASLQEAALSNRGDRIFVAQVSLRNRTGKTVSFGPGHVHVVDAIGVPFPRISEEWLHDFYSAKVNRRPAAVPPEAIVPFPSDEITVGSATLTSPPLTAAEQRKMAEEMATLVGEVFVRPRQETPGSFLVKGPEGALGVLLKDVTLKPGQSVSGFVYFYQAATTRPQYPLRLIADVEGEISTFLFQ